METLQNIGRYSKPGLKLRMYSQSLLFRVKILYTILKWVKHFERFSLDYLPSIPVEKRRRFNVYKTSYRRLIDVETTSCVYWDFFSGSVHPLPLKRNYLRPHLHERCHVTLRSPCNARIEKISYRTSKNIAPQYLKLIVWYI